MKKIIFIAVCMLLVANVVNAEMIDYKRCCYKNGGEFAFSTGTKIDSNTTPAKNQCPGESSRQMDVFGSNGCPQSIEPIVGYTKGVTEEIGKMSTPQEETNTCASGITYMGKCIDCSDATQEHICPANMRTQRVVYITVPQTETKTDEIAKTSVQETTQINTTEKIKAVSEMTIEEKKAKIVELQQMIIKLLTELIKILSEQKKV